jgi:hypothetical protein
MQYRRYYYKVVSHFFTIKLANRLSDLIIKEIKTLRYDLKIVKKTFFHIDAIVTVLYYLHIKF